ncbi:MAG: membrane protein insertase YidC [Hellea sp.]|nr:membrane protein insertase YidC [Hellea sp.]
MQDQGNDQKNFILAMLLSGLVLMAYWFFYGQPLEEMAKENAALELSQGTNKDIELSNRDQTIQTKSPTGQRINIETASISGSFNTEGSRFDDIALKNYDKTLDTADGSVILLAQEGNEKSAYLMDNWSNINGGNGSDTKWTLVSGGTLTETSPIYLEYLNDELLVQRKVSIDNKFLITLSDKVENLSSSEKTITRVGVSRQHNLPDDLTNFFIVQEGPISLVDGKYHDQKYKGLKKKSNWNETGKAGWAGLTDKYWFIANIAPQDQTIKVNYDFKTINTQDVYETSYTLSPLTLTSGSSVESISHLYVGPKERSTLVNYELQGIAEMERAIDWGAMRLIVRPISWTLSFLGSKLGNYGLGILVLTFFIKLFMFPLFNKQYESQAKMKKVQPKVKRLQELYKDDRMKMQQEMMGLYRKEGVNPAAGCLPIIPTIFVFFSLYKAVFINIDLRHEPFFGWIRDLSAKDPLSILNGFGVLPWEAVPGPIPSILAIGPLAILYGISMSLMYTLTPPAGDPMQAKIFKFMPWIFMFILSPFAAGLLIYWVWNNILSFGQQYYITRKFKVDTPVDEFWRKITGKNTSGKE